MMGNTASKKNQPPPIDPSLQHKLVAKFGAKLMKRGFTALPVLVQEYYRHVPGNVLKLGEEINIFTGEVEELYGVTYMTPTEYSIMTAIWRWWWDHQNNPWPSVEQLCGHIKKSERQVRRYLQRLRDKGFMLSLEQFTSDGKQISNRYDFTPFLKRLIAHLDALEQREKGVQPATMGDTFDRERMTDEAGRGCQIRQGIENESDPELSDEENSDSSDSVATTEGTVWGDSMGTCSHIARGTIGTTNESTNGSEKTNDIESNRTSNPSVTEKVMADAECAKEVERALDAKKLTPFERTALKAGVPMDLVDAMQTWYQACPRPEKHPMSVEGIITTFSRELDNMAYLQSNLTQATKLYQYALKQGFGEDDFRAWLYDAAKRARRDGISNKMAYFFTALKIELLVAIVGSQWPQPPEPSESPLMEAAMIHNTAEVIENQEAAGASEEPHNLPASSPSERESEQEPAQMIFCDDPTAGWNSYDTATWWADRLRDHLGKDLYGYTVWPTVHGKWAFIFFALQNPVAYEALVTGAAVTYCIHNGWQSPLQEQS